MHFTVPTVSILIKNQLPRFNVSWAIYIINIIIIKFFDSNKHFTLKIDSDVRDRNARDSFIGPN